MRIRMAEVSLQFGDSDKQHTSDITKIFDRAVDRRYAWIFGTEAGPGSGNTGKELIRIGKEHDYRVWVPEEQAKSLGRATDCWIAVRKDLIESGWKQGYVPVIPGSAQLYKEQGEDPDLQPRWGPKGLVTVEFKSTPQLGQIGLVSMHHLTKGQRPGKQSVIHGVDHHEWNNKLDVAAGKWVAEKAKGSALVFGGLDRNASDRNNPANIPGTTTVADELKKWQNSGHGDIDWIFTTNKDGRVSALNWTVLDDREFHLHTDHFFCEAVARVEPLKR